MIQIYVLVQKMEDIDFAKIIEIRRVREGIEELTEYENQLSSPLRIGGIQVKDLYNIFCQIASERNEDSGIVMQRKKFLFISLYIFAPGVLAGGKMPPGLRTKLSEALNIESHTTISNNCSDLNFLFQNYKSFQTSVCDIFREIMRRINDIQLHKTA